MPSRTLTVGHMFDLALDFYPTKQGIHTHRESARLNLERLLTPITGATRKNSTLVSRKKPFKSTSGKRASSQDKMEGDRLRRVVLKNGELGVRVFTATMSLPVTSASTIRERAHPDVAATMLGLLAATYRN